MNINHRSPFAEKWKPNPTQPDSFSNRAPLHFFVAENFSPCLKRRKMVFPSIVRKHLRRFMNWYHFYLPFSTRKKSNSFSHTMTHKFHLGGDYEFLPLTVIAQKKASRKMPAHEREPQIFYLASYLISTVCVYVCVRRRTTNINSIPFIRSPSHQKIFTHKWDKLKYYLKFKRYRRV